MVQGRANVLYDQYSTFKGPGAFGGGREGIQRAELQRADIGEGMPAPFYFKRVAILFAKQKLYVKEIQICQLYLDSLKDYKKRRGESLAGWTLPDDFYMRIQKAQLKLDKLKNKAIKKGK